MLFPVEPDGSVLLPSPHPLAPEGAYPTAALVELAAQLLGRALGSQAGEAGAGGGVLVELRDLRLLTASVPAGTRLVPEVVLERPSPPLARGRVELPGALSVRLTILVRPS